MSNNKKAKQGSYLSTSASKLVLKFLTRDKIASFNLILSTIIGYISLFILFIGLLGIFYWFSHYG